ncbi:MAG TPA: 4Fe-4S dicluster domain-containing protein [Caldisericia bacterium]|nr:4Fe-4S dicluster domain-containing protein [Caldisericia bacterium]HPF48870.1 4Fe-4S dicluster domain-containing protein [Caldisericia bacterium]HPI83266.1 4Fe-4S dicluster domain-containing protein [Caldisericia bacterium]HPQ92493.1 4Fe-4S dicluster domain-containing protein [Caldisericia bacterium]HRV74409.1 4Fe-4S dicluster domain-containing protein [Caldisericia bacterium]
MNSNILEYIKETVKEALESGKIKAFLGYTDVEGIPGTSRPYLAETPEDVDNLTFNSFCRQNLIRLGGGKTNYFPELPGKKDKLGIMVKGCDSRSMLANTAEGKLDREKLWVVGVACPGTINIERLRATLPAEIKTIKDDGTNLQIELVNGDGMKLDREEYLDVRCLNCKVTKPLDYNFFIPNDTMRTPTTHNFEWVEQYQSKAFSERSEFIQSHLARCTLCFACRDACPACYCNENCIMDRPKLAEPFLHKSNELKNILMYHFIHYYHLADRCTGCGECTRACPENIPLNLITDALGHMQKTAWNFEAGMSDKSKPPLLLIKNEEILED